MKNKFSSLKSKRFLLPFIFVMVLNTILVGVLLRSSLGQTRKIDFSSQQPVKAEVANQKDCPLQITIVNVDNSNPAYQNVIYNIQNVSNKPIRAYTFLADGKSGGKVLTNSFTSELFQIGKSITETIAIERPNIKGDETFLLSIDYVEFEDGNTWGNDSASKSQSIAGERQGRKAAIKRLKDLIKNQSFDGAESVTNLLKQEMGTTVEVPNVNQSEDWKMGYKLGYKSVVSILQNDTELKIESIRQKLDAMEKIAN